MKRFLNTQKKKKNKKIFLLKGKSTIDMLSNVFLPIAGFGLAKLVFFYCYLISSRP